MKKTSALTLFILSTAVATAQNIDSIVSRAAAEFMSNSSKVGVSIGVVKDNQVYQYHFGSTEKSKVNAPNEKTIYEIGSITKTFTSMLLAQALVDKKMDLNDDIRKYLKGSYPNLEYNGQPIKVVHLSNLTSGLPDNLPEKLPAFKSADKDSQLFELKKMHDAYTRTQFLSDLHQVKLNRAPGLYPAHSNTAAQLLGFMLEDVYGMGYAELLKKYITVPLDMKSTFVSVPASFKAFCAKGYNEKGTLMPEIPISAGSAGVLTSSLPDMVKYVAHHLKEKDKRTILAHTLEWGNMESVGIGLNWYLKTNFDGKRKIWASGGTFGFSSYSVIYPERNFAVVVLANESDNGAEGAASNIAQTVYNELFFSAAERASEGFGFSKSINSLLEALNERGFEHAIEVAQQLKEKDASFKLPENEMNEFGYHILNKGQKTEALELFKLNASLYPESSNTYDSLAETYESMGDKASAIKYYKKALELDPSSTNAAEHLKKLER